MPPNSLVVRALKDALAQAESGKIQSFALAAVSNKAETSSYFGGHLNIEALLGEIKILEACIIDKKIKPLMIFEDY